MVDGISWTLLGLLAALLIAAAACDLKKREIPHAIVVAVALLAIPFWWASGLALWPDIALQIGVAALLFAMFAAMFAFGWMGGGDVKLLTALALWLPPMAVLMLLVIMSFAGGVLTIATIIWSRVRNPSATPEIPYGVAIAFAGLWLISERFLNQFG
ncbi:MAG TPA: prepilin peptidase [Allosphingosinicella sp.]|jgi:prepilin peptidase CpaA